jgi:HSP20 family molecular chaperone IbpA
MRNEDLKTEVNDAILTISGERTFDEAPMGSSTIGSSGLQGKFSRSFYLPQTVE